MEIGQIVYSKNGRGKGCAFVVLAVEGEYVYLTDGETRPMHKPKKKKAKHTQPTHGKAKCVSAGKKGLLDAHIRKCLKEFAKNQ